MKEQRFKTNRIAAVSDGVFSIAMTLLVLGLQLPEMDGDISTAAFSDALNRQVPHLVSWIISFSVLCRLWITQHALLKEGGDESRSFTAANFGFLAGISFIPFPTTLLSEHSDQPLSTVIFSAAVVFSGMMLGLMYLVKHHEAKGCVDWKDINPAAKTALVGMPIIGLLACLTAFWNPLVGSKVWMVFSIIGFSVKKRRKS